MNDTNDTHTLHRGSTPLLISFPHVGTHIPADQQTRYTERALQVEDTDWFLDRLYAFAADLGASLVVPRLSRYLIDLNRSSDNLPMYPGQNNTELCPTRHFTGEPIYREGQAPDEAEIRRRVAVYWQPYHDAVQAQLAHLKQTHGHAVLFDAHSIKSELPWLFEGTLPHMNVGTVKGHSCAPSLREKVAAIFSSQSAYSHVMDGRFKGGHITRHFGQPDKGVHAVQLEMCWRAYMDESPPYRWHDTHAAAVTPLLRLLVQTLATWRP
ncbi:MAG: N-formylglutamate deformylase [Rubrivivax sp.]|nr:N-formylglutamate deformylase [Rubrivivax sp.]MDP3611318.1 N-formylglutamate deformylase [Rubrivivax sp.]